MNILLINHYAGSPELGMEFRPYYMAKEWVKQGHKVLIVGATYSHLRKKQPQKVGREIIEGIDYYWVKTNIYRGNGIGRFLSMFLFVFKLMFSNKKIWREFKPEVVIASSTYPMDVFPAKKIADQFKAKLVFEIHDLWPLSPMVLGGYSRYHPFIILVQWAENYAYKYCHKCISILPCVDKYVVKHGLLINKLRVVPNGFNAEEWSSPIELSPEIKYFFDMLKQKNKKILGYIGGHAISNALELLIDAMALITNENIVVVLVGNGVEKEKLVVYAEKKCLKNIFFLEPVIKKMVPSLLKEMDVLYLGGKNHPLYQYGTSQTKLFDYLQAAKPVIQTISPPNNYVYDSQCGITIKESTAQAIAKGIEQMMSYPDQELDKMGKCGKKYCDQYFNYKKLSLDFIQYINE